MTALLASISEGKLEQLRSGIASNIDRYLESGFEDLIRDPGWTLELNEEIELNGLEELDGKDRSATADIANTKIVDRVLGQLAPSLANEERIWVRLSHVEAVRYARDRWLVGQNDEERIISSIERHFFAKTRTGIRDDHAVSRLWWNAYIVRRCYPGDLASGLELLLKTADVRSNMVERIWLTGRRTLASGVFRTMERDQRVLSSERSFREFMKALNLLGGGVVFEALTDSEIDDFLTRCVDRASGELALASTM